MAKFDFAKLKKFDIQGVVDSVKSIINPEVPIPPGMENDPIVAKLTMLKAETQNLSNILEQQQQEISKINTLIASMFKDLETLRKPPVSATESSAPQAEKIEKQNDEQQDK